MIQKTSHVLQGTDLIHRVLQNIEETETRKSVCRICYSGQNLYFVLCCAVEKPCSLKVHVARDNASFY